MIDQVAMAALAADQSAAALGAFFGKRPVQTVSRWRKAAGSRSQTGGERHLRRDNRAGIIRQPVVVHDPKVRDDQERCRDRVGEERGVGEQRAPAQPHPAHAKLASDPISTVRTIVSARSTLYLRLAKYGRRPALTS